MGNDDNGIPSLTWCVTNAVAQACRAEVDIDTDALTPARRRMELASLWLDIAETVKGLEYT